MAEDAVELVLEAVRIIDGADLVTLNAMTEVETFTLAEACEHNLVLHGKVRRLLGAAVVEIAS
jgi:hypothetical protein